MLCQAEESQADRPCHIMKCPSVGRLTKWTDGFNEREEGWTEATCIPHLAHSVNPSDLNGVSWCPEHGETREGELRRVLASWEPEREKWWRCCKGTIIRQEDADSSFVGPTSCFHCVPVSVSLNLPLIGFSHYIVSRSNILFSLTGVCFNHVMMFSSFWPLTRDDSGFLDVPLHQFWAVKIDKHT